MICALLLLRATGASWIPFLAIPGVIAGLSFSIFLIISGVAGLLAPRVRLITRSRRTQDPIALTNSPFLTALRR